MSDRLCPVSVDDLPRFLAEKEPCRQWLRPILRALHRLVAGSGRIGAAIEREAGALGMSAKTMRAYYDLYRHSGGDFASIIDRRRFPQRGQTGGATPEVIALWQRLCEENQRKCRPAWRRLIDLWHRGEPRGMQWPEYDPATGLPMGCTYRNLMRLRPGNFALRAMRNGMADAMGAHGPQVLTTRRGLWVGSHLMIDDLTRDLRVMLLGRGTTARVQELGVFDVFSAHRFAVHRRPQYERADGVKDSIKELEMRWLLAANFHTTGWSPRGTEIVMEKGTATVRAVFAKWLLEQSGGKITTRGPGDVGRVQALLGRTGSGGGNPRHKAHLESHHNLVHNEAGHLPAPTGHDRNPPEWLHGIERETREVLRWMGTLPMARALELRAEMLEYWQALDLLAGLDGIVAMRTEHELEGWIESGLCAVEYCADLIGDRWIGAEEYLALPQSAQDRLAALAERTPELRRARRLAPAEVFARGAGELVRLNDCQLAMFFTDRELGDDLRRPVRLNAAGMIELSDALAAPEPLYFQRTLAARDGGSVRLEERTAYAAVLNPFDCAQLWLFDGRGVFLGTAPRIERAPRLDDHAINLQLGRVAHEKSLLTAELRDRHAGTEAMLAELREHNDRVRNGADADDLGAVVRAGSARRRPVSEAELAELGAAEPLAGSAPTAPEPEPGDSIFDL